MNWLNVHEAFDLKSNAFGFTQDPTNDMCVHYYTRASGRHVGGMLNGLLKPRPGFEEVNAPLEAAQLLFDAQGKVKFFSAGNVCASIPEIQNTNTKGYGAVFGLLCAIGRDSLVSSAKQPAVRSFNNFVSRNFDTFGIRGVLPKTASHHTEIPAWWHSSSSN
mmetsp:Transcript_1142/g.1376  ORF Transcript_1142/g.1376 Transcript_1142/m.1376 type:complete len:162 (-) Transcript_1142:999-1484(-)|eukprot:CAMPEP_0197290890 /NCGR_PEP_ID=MMETSP0890-20130614/10295_1 /TAXON_ID=44058 ORGANISM="Aureoumbra lagunensis, Strain CCMP1510" /NCGR_SAMPLE_ID=MMETSP0890 /ASSEMBLY_ACC=CAM_ASM_000533 /LENGTH=161 /DNA_ID=CAMNT_0042763253 /DNA_START=35 /DNA_END=520 /DNA_ORIENTATION=-